MKKEAHNSKATQAFSTHRPPAVGDLGLGCRVHTLVPLLRLRTLTSTTSQVPGRLLHGPPVQLSLSRLLNIVWDDALSSLWPGRDFAPFPRPD